MEREKKKNHKYKYKKYSVNTKVNTMIVHMCQNKTFLFTKNVLLCTSKACVKVLKDTNNHIPVTSFPKASLQRSQRDFFQTLATLENRSPYTPRLYISSCDHPVERKPHDSSDLFQERLKKLSGKERETSRPGRVSMLKCAVGNSTERASHDTVKESARF